MTRYGADRQPSTPLKPFRAVRDNPEAGETGLAGLFPEIRISGAELLAVSVGKSELW